MRASRLVHGQGDPSRGLARNRALAIALKQSSRAVGKSAVERDDFPRRHDDELFGDGRPDSAGWHELADDGGSIGSRMERLFLI